MESTAIADNLDTTTQFPRQKLPIKEKTTKWRKQCIDASINIIKAYGSVRRQDNKKKQKNYDLLNGNITKADLEYAINPFGIEIQDMSFPAQIQPYDVWSPIFMELFGEEMRRPFSFIVSAVNPEAVTEKEEQRKQTVLEHLRNLITDANPEADPKELQSKLSSLDENYKSYRSMRESRATKFLTYLRKALSLEQIFSKGWKDAIVASEELYSVEEISNEPRVRRVNPLELDFILPHNSDQIDEAEQIVESTFMSISQIIDQFYEELTPDQITKLESEMSDAANSTVNVQEVYIHDKDFTPEFADSTLSSADAKGNKRVYKVTWKSKEKIGFLSFVSPETGELEVRRVSENYKPAKDERVDWRWRNQYWEGWRIGGPEDDIYLSMRPKKLQFRRMDNISACKSGYIGTIYNCDNTKAVSIMDRITPFIHLYIILFYNTELAIATNWGKIPIIDVSLIPDGWDIEKWMHYARVMKIGFVNSYNEGKKGERKGQLNQSQQTKQLDLETGNYIQQHISLLEFVEKKIQDLAGVPRQRLGEMKASDGLGNTEHALNQASFVTEPWFQVHNNCKKRVLEALIETAKSCWEGKTKHIQYFMDDMSSVFETVDMNEFSDSEYGVFVTNSAKDTEALTMVKQLMQAAVQNDKADLSTIIDILNSESTADVKARLMKSEELRHQRQQAEIEKSNEAVTATERMRQEGEQQKMEWQAEQNQLDRESNEHIAEIKALGGAAFGAKDADLDDNGVPDVLEIEKLRQKDRETSQKLGLERQKLVVTQVENAKQRRHEEKLKAIDLKKAKMDNDTKVKVAKSKPKPKPTKK